jgi:hypothetical protein
VSVPILEVDLADLDGDGLTELAAVEAPADAAARHVTDLPWRGRGFGLVWWNT